MLHKQILKLIDENDVKFIRLAFCDPMGTQKNISIISSELEQAFTQGKALDVCALPVFSEMSNTDLLLFPDPSSFSLLPWRPRTNSVLRFYCDIKNPDGTNFSGDGRNMLKNAVNDLNALGFTCKIGTKCEFYLFENNENDEYSMKTFDKGGYLDISPLDKGENIRREICLYLEQMGLNPERSFHEKGPGQNEIDFKFDDPLFAADNFLTFKSVVKSIAKMNDLFASFMPKPFLNNSGSGLHLNMSLIKDGENIFSDKQSKNYKYAENFIAGILDKIAEITLFLNPINNSYERFGSFEAPKYISWSSNVRSQLIKIPVANKGSERIDLRSPDSTINPYIAFSLILQAGLFGIKNNLQLSRETEKNFNEIGMQLLPKDLGEAINSAENSEFVKKIIDSSFLESYLNLKKNEFAQFEKATNKEEYYKKNDFLRL